MLVQKPQIQNWMSPEEKDFREHKSGDIIHRLLSTNSFLGYKLEGYFDNGIQSVVALVSKGESKIVLKLKLSSEELIKEAKILELLEKEGINSVKVNSIQNVELFSVLVLDYVEETRSSILVAKDQTISSVIAEQVGRALAKMHSIKFKEYGDIQVRDNKLVPTNVPLSKLFMSEFECLINTEFEEYQKNLDINLLVNYQDKEVQSGRLCHLDLGLHNCFGIEPITIFDGVYRSHSPMFDFAISYIWFHYLGEETQNALTKSYSENVEYWDSDVFGQFLKLACLYKLNKWVPRSKHEKKVLNWIETPRYLLQRS